MKVLVTTSTFSVEESEALQLLKSLGFELILNPYGRKLTQAELLNLLDPDVVGMIAGVEQIDEHTLSRATGLKVISRCGAGIDSIDLDAAKQKGVSVFNTPDAPTQAVAELTLGLILSAVRQIAWSDRLVRSGSWKPMLKGTLGGRTVGVVGYGRIGRRVAALLRAFGADVIVADSIVAATEPEVSLVSIDELVARADIISLHVPYDAQTANLFNEARIAQMRRGSILVNTSRGGLIDEAALAEAIRSGHLAGAAIDVFVQEPYTGELAGLDNVILSPHAGSRTRETRARMEREAAENLLAGLRELRVII